MVVRWPRHNPLYLRSNSNLSLADSVCCRVFPDAVPALPASYKRVVSVEVLSLRCLEHESCTDFFPFFLFLNVARGCCEKDWELSLLALFSLIIKNCHRIQVLGTVFFKWLLVTY